MSELDIPNSASRPTGSLGFVPTMGALHAGHLSLIQTAAAQCDEVVVSIFVNPAQFGPGEDFEQYPRSLDADADAARAAGANYIYAPAVTDIYPNYPELTVPQQAGESSVVTPHLMRGLALDLDLNPGPLAADWEGAVRPGHFDGVVKVVKRLFDLVQPDRAYFGEKDFQQLRVIEDMVDRLQLPVEIVRCPTQRDTRGLALSSRNQYLSAAEYETALTISAALSAARNTVLGGESSAEPILDAARAQLDPSIALDYLAIVDEQTLKPVAGVDALRHQCARIIFAGRVGTTRLIDNQPLS
ncbi:MAG: pantoate--beta-alanine ligase [Coriobacteriia bacterium]|nr:pantoate--beta-alanine ligase [Coriobacteriia bacterium]MCL2537536.1 pantoate--beta-alanine ligase [Coriobacteriia bacterium]